MSEMRRGTTVNRQAIATFFCPLALVVWVLLRIALFWSMDSQSFLRSYAVEISIAMLALPLLAGLVTYHISHRLTPPVIYALVGESLIYVLNAGLFLKLFSI